MSDARLPAELWIKAHIRRCIADGIPAAVVHRGETNSGMLILKINQLEAGVRVISQTRDMEGAVAWMPALGGKLVADASRDLSSLRLVSYGAAPNKVIEVLEQVARAHSKVLRHPKPQALFMGYGDSSINFELRVWPTQFHQWGQVRSDLAVAVFDAVNAADGMSFPFPQREVRILSDHDSGSPAVSRNAAKID